MLSYLLGTGVLEAVTEVLIGSMNGWEQAAPGAVLTEGSTLDPILQISIPVGGPLASVRPEAVAFLCHLQQIREKMDVPGIVPVRLTVFIDCLCLLQFLSKWGNANYWPGPKEIIHFGPTSSAQGLAHMAKGGCAS